jgi:hypothetical protein
LTEQVGVVGLLERVEELELGVLEVLEEELVVLEV